MYFYLYCKKFYYLFWFFFLLQLIYIPGTLETGCFDPPRIWQTSPASGSARRLHAWPRRPGAPGRGWCNASRPAPAGWCGAARSGSWCIPGHRSETWPVGLSWSPQATGSGPRRRENLTSKYPVFFFFLILTTRIDNMTELTGQVLSSVSRLRW